MTTYNNQEERVWIPQSSRESMARRKYVRFLKRLLSDVIAFEEANKRRIADESSPQAKIGGDKK